MDVQKAFGKKVRQLRTKKGLSQEKFALLIGMDRTYFASVEAGKRNISIRNIQKIAEGLEAPLSKLFDDLEGEYADGSKGLSNLSSSGDNT